MEHMSLRSALRRIYDSSSVPVQTRMRMVYGRLPARWKLGAEFDQYCKQLLGNEQRSGEEMDALQLERLRAMIRHCQEKVPFYQKAFARVGFRPEHFKTLDDLRHIPVLTRQDLQDNFDELKAGDPSTYQPEKSYSGGSTGEP